jgi:RES domain/HEPN/RES N-terminal domain 1
MDWLFQELNKSFMQNSLQKYVCLECAGNNELKEDVFSRKKEKKTCSYCRKRRLCIKVDFLANAIDDIYREGYEQCDNGNSPSEIISAEILELDNSAGKLDIDLVNILSDRESSSEYKDREPMYDECMTYSSIDEKYPPINDGREHKELWDVFCKQIKHRTRFFNHKVIDWLNDIFLDLDKISYKDGVSPIRTIQPTDSNAVFFRARKAANAQERIKICCNPTQELSSPPVILATNGRMNPIGISVFYAAYERETCIAEIRLPVGEMAISGKFKLEKPIIVFDLTVFDKIDSKKTIDDYLGTCKNYWNADLFEDRLEFLHKFSAEISKPVSPHKEALDYMPTQALIEYLAHHYKPNIDAVIYASTQTNGKGKNIVFLNQATKVVNNQSFKSGSYKAMWGDDYYQISPIRKLSKFEFDLVQWDEYEQIIFDENFDQNQDEFLSFVPDSLKIHKIMAINYHVDYYNVIAE